MKKKNAAIVLVVIVLLGCGAFLLRGQFVRLYYYVTLPNVNVSTPDLSEIQDGRYQGEYDGHFVSAKVTVVIENHQIIDIILDEHNNQRGKSAEIITDRIVEAQSLEVDAISGATQSSKVIQKSVENALENALSNN